VLAAAGVFHPRRRVATALTAMALGSLVFSFGPGLYLTHPPTLDPNTNDVALSAIPAPGRLLRQLPGFNDLRGWARLGFFVEIAVGLLAAAGLARLLDWIKERCHANGAAQIAMAVLVISFALVDFFPVRAGMTPVTPRPVDSWLSVQPGNFAFMEYPIPRHGYGGPAIYTTRLTGKRIIMGSSQNPPNLAFWPDLSAFPSPTTLDLLYDWGAKYVLVDENLYRAGSSFWNIYQTWDTLEPAITGSSRLKEVAILNGVHVYELGSGPREGRELLTNTSFEDGNANSLPGWTMVGKPTIDRTSKYAYGGRTGCAVTEKDFLVSAPVPVESTQCYRLAVHQRADSLKPGKLLLQLDWKSENNDDIGAPATLVANAPLAGQSQESSLVVRAPTGSRYAVVHAGAASGKVWVDDYSLKKIPSDCAPVLFVTPNPVSMPAGHVGRAAITWNSCCNSEGRVELKINDNAEQPFAVGQSGLAFLDGIKPGVQYELRLYSKDQLTAVQTSSLKGTLRTATIAADPNPVPPGPGAGRTRIFWATLTGENANVYVSQNSGPEHLFARGPTGYANANWIVSGNRYEFRLYSAEGPRRVLAKVLVTR
jgi:hypothetical protein